MSSPTDPFLELEASSRILRDGLTLLDRRASGDADQDDAGRLAAWQKIMDSLAEAPAPELLREVVPVERRDEFDDELAELIRLNAILVAAVRAEQEHVASKLRKVREVRREMAYYDSVAPEGDRCDISG